MSKAKVVSIEMVHSAPYVVVHLLMDKGTPRWIRLHESNVDSPLADLVGKPLDEAWRTLRHLNGNGYDGRPADRVIKEVMGVAKEVGCLYGRNRRQIKKVMTRANVICGGLVCHPTLAFTKLSEDAYGKSPYRLLSTVGVL